LRGFFSFWHYLTRKIPARKQEYIRGFPATPCTMAFDTIKERRNAANAK